MLRLPIAFLAVAVFGLSCAEPSSEVKDASAESQPVRIALFGDPSTLDPHLQDEVIAQDVLGNVYDALVTFDSEMRLVPQLASARMYMCVDEATGATSFTDKACETTGTREEIKVNPINPGDRGAKRSSRRQTWRSDVDWPFVPRDHLIGRAFSVFWPIYVPPVYRGATRIQRIR